MRLFAFSAILGVAAANQCQALRDQSTACRALSQEACNAAKGCEFYGDADTGECNSPVSQYEGLRGNDASAGVVAYDYWDFIWREAPSTDSKRTDRWPNGFRRAVMHEHNNPPFCLTVPDTKNTEVKVMVESDNPNARLCIVSQEYEELGTLNPTALMKRCDFGQVTACFPASVEDDLNLMIYCEDSCPEGETPFHYQVFHSDRRDFMDSSTATACTNYRNKPCGYKVSRTTGEYELDGNNNKIPEPTYMVNHRVKCCPPGQEANSAQCSPIEGATCTGNTERKSEYCCNDWGYENAADDVVDMWCMLLQGADTKTGHVGNSPSAITQATAQKLVWPSMMETSIPDNKYIPSFSYGNGAVSSAPGVAIFAGLIAAFAM